MIVAFLMIRLINSRLYAFQGLREQSLFEDCFDNFAMRFTGDGVADAQQHPLVIEETGEPTTGIQF